MDGKLFLNAKKSAHSTAAEMRYRYRLVAVRIKFPSEYQEKTIYKGLQLYNRDDNNIISRSSLIIQSTEAEQKTMQCLA